MPVVCTEPNNSAFPENVQGRVLQQIFTSTGERAWLRDGCPVCSTMKSIPSHTAAFQPLMQKRSFLPCPYHGLCYFLKSSLFGRMNPRNTQGKCFQNPNGHPLVKREYSNYCFKGVHWAGSILDIKQNKEQKQTNKNLPDRASLTVKLGSSEKSPNIPGYYVPLCLR